MKASGFLRDHLLGWTVIAYGTGVGTTIALLGIPPLWSAEAAGWASAIGTLIAAGVALWLGLKAINIDARSRSHRSAVAKRKVQVIARRIFDELEMVGNGPGIAGGLWDERTINSLLNVTRRLDTACRELEQNLLDLDESVSMTLTQLFSTAQGLCAQIFELERHDPQTQIHLADYITTGVYHKAHGLVATEKGQMAAIGVDIVELRMKVNRTARESDN